MGSDLHWCSVFALRAPWPGKNKEDLLAGGLVLAHGAVRHHACRHGLLRLMRMFRRSDVPRRPSRLRQHWPADPCAMPGPPAICLPGCLALLRERAGLAAVLIPGHGQDVVIASPAQAWMLCQGPIALRGLAGAVARMRPGHPRAGARACATPTPRSTAPSAAARADNPPPASVSRRREPAPPALPPGRPGGHPADRRRPRRLGAAAPTPSPRSKRCPKK